MYILYFLRKSTPPGVFLNSLVLVILGKTFLYGFVFKHELDFKPESFHGYTSWLYFLNTVKLKHASGFTVCNRIACRFVLCFKRSQVRALSHECFYPTVSMGLHKLLYNLHRACKLFVYKDSESDSHTSIPFIGIWKQTIPIGIGSQTITSYISSTESKRFCLATLF